MRSLAPFLLVTLANGSALAGATPWQDIAPGVKARLISSDKLEHGTTLAGLQLDMPSGTKTYWRVPGETGIPAQFDFSRSSGLTSPAIDWPYPQIDRSQGYRDYVYYGSLVIPVRFIAAQGGGTVDASITLGICSDICVPVLVKFTLPVSFANPDIGQSIRLQQAEARAPVLWDKPVPAFGAIAATPEGLAIDSPDPSIDPATLIAEVADPAVVFESPQKSPDGTIWTLKRLGGAATTGLEGQAIQLTFMTPSGPYAVSSRISAPAR